MSTKVSNPTLSHAGVEVTLDGKNVSLPAERRSLGAIRSFLETLAMEQQRILFKFEVNTVPAECSNGEEGFSRLRVEAETADLDDLPSHLLDAALQQVCDARASVQNAVTLVLINDQRPAQEFWWELAQKLKQPLLTLSLLPEDLYNPHGGYASPMQLRKWQLQQLASLIKEVDHACWLPDAMVLSNALENRVLPWLDRLHEIITLMRDTVEAGSRRFSY